MWYFSWLLGIGVALAFGVINVMWLESRAGRRGQADEEDTLTRTSAAR